MPSDADSGLGPLVRALIEQWREDVEEYPDTTPGTYAAAAVQACAKELEHVIATGELIDDESDAGEVPEVVSEFEVGDDHMVIEEPGRYRLVRVGDRE